MCDDTPVRLLLAAAAAAILTAVGLIVAAAIANVSFFGAWASPGLMVGAAIASGVAAASVGLAIAAINIYVDCLKRAGLMGSQCEGELQNTLRSLAAVGAVLLAQAGAAAGAAGFAWIPFAGATAMGIIGGTLVLQLPLIASALVFLGRLRSCAPPPSVPPTGPFATIAEPFTIFGFDRR